MKRSVLLISFIAFTFLTIYGQSIVYVNPLATGDQSGSSWSNAYTNLPDAIQNTSPGSEIWVSNSATLYVTKTNTQTDHIIINKELEIYGGFDGTETSVDQRDLINPFPSIISGAIGTSSTSDNSHNSFIVRSNVLIDGFSFMFFNSNFTGLPYYGIVAADTNSNVIIKNTLFVQNEGQVRGICLSAHKNSTINLENIAATNNTTSGSLISRNDNASISVNNSHFENNGSPSEFCFIFYSMSNGNPSQFLNEELLLNVQDSDFSSNNSSIAYSYFGSHSFKKCNFDLAASLSYTFTFSGDSSSITIDSCSFTGTYQSTFLNVSGHKEVLFTNNEINNPFGNNQSFLEIINCKNSYVQNSKFNNLKGSIPLNFNGGEGKVIIQNCNFLQGNAGSYFLNINTKSFLCKGNRFENITASLGNAFDADSAFFKNCIFQTLNSGSFLFPFNYVSFAEIDSCEFSYLSQPYSLFIYPQKLIFKNSKVKSSSISSYNPGSPFLFGNWGGDVTLINNQFEQIFTYGNLIGNSGTLTAFGNTFKLITTTYPFFYNRKDLKVYNCNFEDLSMPLFYNDTSYSNNTTPISFELINNVIYSSNDTVVFNTINPFYYSESISDCFTNNDDLNGTNITKDFTTPYSDLYSGGSHLDLTDLGADMSSFPLLPSADVNGNPRIINSTIDIGAIEFQGSTTFLFKESEQQENNCFPNPGKDYTQLEVKDDALLEIITMEDSLKTIIQLQAGLNKIDVSNLQDGTYIFSVMSDTESQRFLFVKQ